MKILVAKFQLEANEHVDMKCDLPNVALSYGRDALEPYAGGRRIR